MVFKVLKGLMGLQRLRYGLKYCYDNPWVGLGLCAKCGGCQPSSVCKKGKHTDRRLILFIRYEKLRAKTFGFSKKGVQISQTDI